MAVEQIGPKAFRWTIQGPLGIRVNSTIKVTEERTNELIRYETTGVAGLKGYWEVHFARGSHHGETEIREVMKIPLGRLARVGLALIGKFPADEVSSNLHRLKELLETGRVTDTSHAVPGLSVESARIEETDAVMRGDGSKTRFLLYGAYGYTGRLAAEIAVAKGLDVVLASRNQDALAELGDQLRLPTRVIGLDDDDQLFEALKDIACVVHMAGPFAVTSAPMLNACLATQTNYVDITGEIEVFEAMWSRKEQIARAGITAVPGAGFDVVPTDCLAGYVASKLERPASLVIALRGLESASQGTLRTAIRQVSKPVLCRRAGAIVALDDRSARYIDFGSGAEPCVAVSWGDVATAFHSTGVANITVYLRSTKLLHSVDLFGTLFGRLLRSRIGQRGLAAIVRRLPEGPSSAERSRHRSTIWAEASGDSGNSFKATLSTPDAYDFAANSALEIASRIDSLAVPLGLVTPFQAFGADFVLNLPGCSRADITSS